jgi:hypothetical protein
VGRPPQELIRGWGRPPICKASRPEHGMGIQATRNLSEEGKKGSVVVDRGRPMKNVETREETLWVQGGIESEK